MCGRNDGRKCRKTEKEMHVVKGESLQKEVCTEERKCFTEANTWGRMNVQTYGRKPAQSIWKYSWKEICRGKEWRKYRRKYSWKIERRRSEENVHRRKEYKRMEEVEKEIRVGKGSICRRKYARMEASTETKQKLKKIQKKVQKERKERETNV